MSHVSDNDPTQSEPWYDDDEPETYQCIICGEQVEVFELAEKDPPICENCSDRDDRWEDSE